MSDNAITLSQPLHERVYERIRDSIGDLMTDEDLKILVNKATEKAFFEPRRNPKKKDSWDAQPEFLEAPFLGMIEDLMKDDVRNAVNQWIKDHPKEIAKLIDDRIDAGIVQMVTRAFDAKLQQSLTFFGENLRQQLTHP